MASITTAPHRPPTGVGRRRQRNRLTWGLCTVALALVVIPVVWIVGGVIDRTVSHFHFSLLTTYPVGNGGGLLNSIKGTPASTSDAPRRICPRPSTAYSAR
jgi:ABC-type phosphate transport system permease subunit